MKQPHENQDENLNEFPEDIQHLFQTYPRLQVGQEFNTRLLAQYQTRPSWRRQFNHFFGREYGGLSLGRLLGSAVLGALAAALILGTLPATSTNTSSNKVNTSPLIANSNPITASGGRWAQLYRRDPSRHSPQRSSDENTF